MVAVTLIQKCSPLSSCRGVLLRQKHNKVKWTPHTRRCCCGSYRSFACVTSITKGCRGVVLQALLSWSQPSPQQWLPYWKICGAGLVIVCLSSPTQVGAVIAPNK